MWHSATLCHTIPHYATLCYSMAHYATSFHPLQPTLNCGLYATPTHSSHISEDDWAVTFLARIVPLLEPHHSTVYTSVKRHFICRLCLLFLIDTPANTQYMYDLPIVNPPPPHSPHINWDDWTVTFKPCQPHGFPQYRFGTTITFQHTLHSSPATCMTCSRMSTNQAGQHSCHSSGLPSTVSDTRATTTHGNPLETCAWRPWLTSSPPTPHLYTILCIEMKPLKICLGSRADSKYFSCCYMLPMCST